MQLPDSLDAALDAELWLGLGASALKIVLIIGLALIVLGVVGQVKRRWVRRVEALPTLDEKRQRVLTVAGLVGSVVRYVVWGVAAIMVLGELGLDVGPLLAGAGIAGLAIGFGAQTLVKDVISGLFLLFDDTIGVGDLIRFGADEGTVEYVGLRLIKARKFDGELLMIPAGELRVFGNKSIGFARAIVDVTLREGRGVNEALAALEAVVRAWAETEPAQAVLLDEAPEVQAVGALGDAAVTARIVARVRPGEQLQVERELRRLVQARLADWG